MLQPVSTSLKLMVPLCVPGPFAARGVTIPNVVVPVLILYGGVFQSLVGMWEMVSSIIQGGPLRRP